MDEVRDIDAKHALDALLDRVARGEEITITRDGRPIARLVHAGPSRDRQGAQAAAARLLERSREMSLAPDTPDALRHAGHKY